jgi:hypothetical protein
MSGDGRIGLAAAVAFGVLYLMSGLVVAAPPAPDAPAAEIQRYFVNHADAIATSAWLLVVATVPLLVFLAVLRGRLAAAAAGWLGDLALGGGLVLAGAGVGALMISLGLALHPDFNPPETVRVLVDVQRFFAPLVTGAVCSLALAVAVASLRHGALPAWAGVVSLLYAAYEVVESATVFGGDTGGFAPGESVNLVGTLGFPAWAVVVGIGLARPYPRGYASAGHAQAD